MTRPFAGFCSVLVVMALAGVAASIWEYGETVPNQDWATLGTWFGAEATFLAVAASLYLATWSDRLRKAEANLLVAKAALAGRTSCQLLINFRTHVAAILEGKPPPDMAEKLEEIEASREVLRLYVEKLPDDLIVLASLSTVIRLSETFAQEGAQFIEFARGKTVGERMYPDPTKPTQGEAQAARAYLPTLSKMAKRASHNQSVLSIAPKDRVS